MKVAIIGGGAAGFFSAIAAKENYPDAQVVIFEKSQKILSKVRISGGGRCNVTNANTDKIELSKAYPRGNRMLQRAFYTFGAKDTMTWFEKRGVPLVIQDDNCVFPAAQNSQSVIDCYLGEVKRLGISIRLGCGVKSLKSIKDAIELHFLEEKHSPKLFDKVIVTTGGSPKLKGLSWLEDLNHKIVAPVPSLFTFNMPSENITSLMGVVVEKTIVNIQGTKMQSNGPLLITHWGMSGPAILKLSSLAAIELNKKAYSFKIQINWLNEKNNDIVLAELQNMAHKNANKNLANVKPAQIPERLWLYLLEKGGFPQSKKWGELGKKGLYKLVHLLSNDMYSVEGKTTFKEEFVTCGGVSLESINNKTMESKLVKNLYFAGEVLDIDGITGGYNFQAAWTTGYIAAKLV